MSAESPILHPLPHNITIIDLMESGVAGRTGCYVIKSDKIAIIETGSSLSAPHIIAGLEHMGISPEQVDYIIVTHIHLDHAGGVGYILPRFPNATVVVHPRGARHLIDPSRLIQGARAVYGDKLEEYFGVIFPVPEERVLIRDEGDTLDLGGGRVLSFYDTPGHARHHFSIHDPISEGIFTGDTIGVRYAKQLTGLDYEPIFPSTSPSEFDRDAVFQSADKLEKLGAKRIYHSHFGVTEPASVAFARIRETVATFAEIARSSFAPGMDYRILMERLAAYIREDMVKQGHPIDSMKGFEIDLELNAKGLIFTLEREASNK
jgi:glyoxylase-like metal-dependent hydrolase (beta-lactamase superfamily II)